MDKKTQVLIADDHHSVRAGVARVIESMGWQVCAEAATGLETLERLHEVSPDVVIQDLVLPGMDGLELLAQTKQSHPHVEVVIFTGNGSESAVFQSFDAGARSFILKTDPMAWLMEALTSAVDHKPYFTPRVAEIVFARFQRRDKKAERPPEGKLMTDQDSALIKLIAEGKTNKEMAVLLDVSLRTAEGKRAVVMEKHGLKSLGELIRFAIRNKLVEP